MASSVVGCSLNSPSARPAELFQKGTPPLTPRPRGLWRLGPLGQNHGGKAFQSKNTSRTSSPFQPPYSS